ncbi:N-acetylmuramic acid 6-phosphate etherase [Microbacterium abyssi]|uniref:N-acetylmuramic acid 6-phosphate etherase n=1 Tax=Microbacterium abyssi TaxID=2782166 RepID=UPI001887031D|nr:N-acetylmuramic acid 6-phosphate etherase [Microbacterium sp. A18JL241]
MIDRPTEQRNPATTDIDLVDSARALEMIVHEDSVAVTAVRSAIPSLAKLVDGARERLAAGGRLHYFGAGASGRLAVLDATELNPTYGYPRDRVIAHFPGGPAALADSSIDEEDAEDAGARDATEVTGDDVVVGITASGLTPYVKGALASARAQGALTALVTNDPASDLGALADILVALDTGPEPITGSTRMKAGTATKVALNAFSSAVMIGLGRTYSNLMIEMVATNRKLRERAIQILVEASEAPEARCREVLDEAAGRVPVALIALLTGGTVDSATKALHETGSVRRAMSKI